MKKILRIILISSLVITATACGSNKPDKDINSDNVGIKDETQENQEGIILSDIKIEEKGASNIVTGVAKNTKNATRNLNVYLKIYNGDKLLGKVKINLNDMKYNESRNFEMSLMGDYTSANRFEVEVKDL